WGAFAGFAGSAAGDLPTAGAAGWGARGRTLWTTRAHSASSSGLRRRTEPRQRALRHQDPGAAPARHAAGDPCRLVSRAPEGVEPVRPFDRAARILRHPNAARLRPVELEEDRRA